jgi:hypothetical protein
MAAASMIRTRTSGISVRSLGTELNMKLGVSNPCILTIVLPPLHTAHGYLSE